MKNVMKPVSEKETKKVDAFSVEEQKELIKRFKTSKYGNMFSIAMFTGARIGEILALQPSDVDLDKNIIHITKTLSKDKYETKRNKKEKITERSVNIHMLRHTYETRCIEAGMPAGILQKLLGYNNITTTINTYTTIFDKYRDNEVLKILKNCIKNQFFRI